MSMHRTRAWRCAAHRPALRRRRTRPGPDHPDRSYLPGFVHQLGNSPLRVTVNRATLLDHCRLVCLLEWHADHARTDEITTGGLGVTKAGTLGETECRIAGIAESADVSRAVRKNHVLE